MGSDWRILTASLNRHSMGLVGRTSPLTPGTLSHLPQINPASIVWGLIRKGGGDPNLIHY